MAVLAMRNTSSAKNSPQARWELPLSFPRAKGSSLLSWEECPAFPEEMGWLWRLRACVDPQELGWFIHRESQRILSWEGPTGASKSNNPTLEHPWSSVQPLPEFWQSQHLLKEEPFPKSNPKLPLAQLQRCPGVWMSSGLSSQRCPKV